SVFHAVAKPVNRAIDKIIDLITKKGKTLWNKLKGKEKNGENGSKKDRERKEKELPQALHQAKEIISSHNEKDSPVNSVTDDLQGLRKKFTWIKGFTATKKDSGFSLSMKASHHALGSYTEIQEIKNQLNHFAPTFKEKVHTHWWEHQLKRPKTDSGQLWERNVLDQTEAKAMEYIQDDKTAHDVKSRFYEGNNRKIGAAAFEGHVFAVKSPIRKQFVKLLGSEALKELKKQGRRAAREVPETREIINSMKFRAAQDTYGVYEPFPPSAEDREHTDFYPVSVDVTELTADKSVTTVRTRAGKTFTVTENIRTGLELEVKGVDLRLKESGAPRGVTQGSPGFVANQNLNRSHVIADWFGGSGYREALNLVTASDHYNKVVMGDAESEIATEVIAFAQKHNLTRSQVAMDLTVTVTFGELLRDVFMRNIQNQEWYTPGDPEAEAQLKKIITALLTPPARRVMGVIYSYAITSTTSDAQPKKDVVTIQSDDHLFIRRSASQ
ncbi:hypothetical protein ACF07T_21155, partial [Streptomyces sp. NPDC015184]|uniref:hypothetical protein n=1 Tax=Streptomyces sp. NPDC015184 TaxID=3364946 RepID=UPI0036FF1E31